MRNKLAKLATLAVFWANMAQASETITYTYDARGRVVAAAHSGSVNSNVTITYEHDKADNRVRAKVIGAP